MALQLSHRSGVQCPSVAPRRAGGPVNRGDAETRCASLQKYVKYLKMKIVSAVHEKSEEWCRDRAVSVVGHLSAICWSGLRAPACDRPELRGASHAHAKMGEGGGVCGPRVFCASKNPSFLAGWRVRGRPAVRRPAGTGSVQYDSAEWEPAFLRQAREFPFFPLLPREASK
jgi:hypothetical protein